MATTGSEWTLLWGAASATALVALGATAVLRPRARVPGAAAFALFAILWGLQVALIHIGTFVATGVPHIHYLLALSLLLVLPLFLLGFARELVPWVLPHAAWGVAYAVPALTASVSVVLLFVAPHLMLEDVVRSAGTNRPVWGTLMPLLVNLPLFGTIAFALILFERARRSAATPRVAHRLRYLVIGLALYTGYNAGSNLVYFTALTAESGRFADLLHAVLFAAVASALVLLTLSAWRPAPHVRDTGQARATALALLLPLLAGVAEGLLVIGPLPRLNLIALWRLVGVAFLAYGVELWRSDAVAHRLGRTLQQGGAAVGALAGGVVAYGITALLSTGLLLPLVTGAAGAALTYAPSRRLSQIASDHRTAHAHLPERAYDERIDTYRAALEMSFARGGPARDRRFLAALRERLGITPDEDRLLVHLTRQTIIPVRRSGPTAAYERLRLLGEGGAGRTWLARDRRRDDLVVLKEPLDAWQAGGELADQVVREARLAAKVQNRHVVRIHEVVDQGPLPVIVMDYLPGGSLADLLREDGTLPWPRVRMILLDVLTGLAAVHAQGIVHRDIKPSNVLFDDGGAARIADFGIAIQAGTGQTVLETDRPVGSHGYMPPEVLDGRTRGTTRGDIYACGVLLHHCLYGAPPTPGPPPDGGESSRTRNGHAATDHVPRAVLELIERATAPDPDERIPDAATLAAEIGRIPP